MNHLTDIHFAALRTAALMGRVSRLTADSRVIAHLVKFGFFRPGDLAGIWEPTVDGLCAAGYHPF